MELAFVTKKLTRFSCKYLPQERKYDMAKNSSLAAAAASETHTAGLHVGIKWVTLVSLKFFPKYLGGRGNDQLLLSHGMFTAEKSSQFGHFSSLNMKDPNLA